MHKTKYASIDEALNAGDFEVISLEIPIAVFKTPVTEMVQPKNGKAPFPKTTYAIAIVHDADGIARGCIEVDLSEYVSCPFPSNGVKINSFADGLAWESKGSTRKRFRVVSSDERMTEADFDDLRED